MANRYLYSGAGAAASPYTTADWNQAATSLSAIDGVDTAGDTIYVNSTHAETVGASATYGLAGTVNSPTFIISSNSAALGGSPPTASATGGKITANAASTNLTFNGSAVIIGMQIETGSGQSTTCNLTIGNSASGKYRLFDCALRLLSSGASSRITLGSGAGSTINLFNTTVKFSNASQGVNPVYRLTWDGGGLESGGTTPTALFVAPGSNGLMFSASGLDLSAAGTSSTMCIFTAGTAGTTGVIRDSRLPASWAGSVASGTVGVGERYEMYNCSDGAQNYYIRIADNAGSLAENTSTYRDSGYSMDGTSMSWKVTGASNTNWPLRVFYTPEFGIWVDGASGYTTVTVAVATDNITLTDRQCWLEVMSLDSASYPLGTYHADDSARVSTTNWIAAASNQTTDVTRTWTGVPGTPVKQQLTAAIAPGMSGYILCRVGVAISGSQTVYIDPKPILA